MQLGAEMKIIHNIKVPDIGRTSRNGHECPSIQPYFIYSAIAGAGLCLGSGVSLYHSSIKCLDGR